MMRRGRLVAMTPQPSQALKLRSKLLTPLRDKVGLVNDEVSKSLLFRCLEEGSTKSTEGGFGRSKQDWEAPIPQCRYDRRLFLN